MTVEELEIDAAEARLLSLTPPPKVETFHRITLEKAVDDGLAPVGERYEYTYKTALEFHALGNASKALLRDRKGENRDHWMVVSST